MVYETYETESFVLSGKNIGEGDKVFYLFTRDFGLVRAYAKNIRAEKSKLRYHLQFPSRAYVAVVRGKEYWRIVGVKDADHFFVSLGYQPELLALLSRVFNLLLRFLPGEEKNQALFDIVKVFVIHMQSNTDKDNEFRHAELLVVARLLHALGYFPGTPHYRKFFEHEEISSDLLAEVAVLEKDFLTDINTSLRESHL